MKAKSIPWGEVDETGTPDRTAIIPEIGRLRVDRPKFGPVVRRLVLAIINPWLAGYEVLLSYFTTVRGVTCYSNSLYKRSSMLSYFHS